MNGIKYKNFNVTEFTIDTQMCFTQQQPEEFKSFYKIELIVNILVLDDEGKCQCLSFSDPLLTAKAYLQIDEIFGIGNSSAYSSDEISFLNEIGLIKKTDPISIGDFIFFVLDNFKPKEGVIEVDEHFSCLSHRIDFVIVSDYKSIGFFELKGDEYVEVSSEKLKIAYTFLRTLLFT